MHIGGCLGPKQTRLESISPVSFIFIFTLSPILFSRFQPSTTLNSPLTPISLYMSLNERTHKNKTDKKKKKNTSEGSQQQKPKSSNPQPRRKSTHSNVPNATERRMARFTPSTANRTTTLTAARQLPSRASSDYFRALINPKDFSARIPDSEPRATCVFRSVNSFNVPINIGTTSDSGRFSFVCRPTLGSTASPDLYQTALVDGIGIGTKAWSNLNFASAGNYVSNNVAFGRDPRLDVNTGVMTSPPPSFFGMDFTNTTADMGPTVLVSGITGNQTVNSLNYGSTPTIRSPADGIVPAVTVGQMNVPYGEWNLSLSAKYQTSVTPAGGYLAINAASITGSVVYNHVDQPQSLCPTNGLTYTVSTNIQFTSSPNASTLYLVLDNNQTGTTLDLTSYANCTVSASYMSLSPAYFSGTPTANSTGVIEEIRPVGMAMLATYIGPLLNNGGEIAVSCVTSKALINNYFTRNSGGVGQLQFIENLRQTDGCYDGKLADGVWQSWAPLSDEDFDLYDPVNFSTHAYPAIVCSGVWNPGAGAVTSSGVLRVNLYTVYEFRTDYTMYEHLAVHGSHAEVDSALRLLRSDRMNCANGKHLDMIKNAMSRAAQFYRDNASIINPAAGALMSLL